jgi:hypothetical protein
LVVSLVACCGWLSGRLVLVDHSLWRSVCSGVVEALVSCAGVGGSSRSLFRFEDAAGARLCVGLCSCEAPPARVCGSVSSRLGPCRVVGLSLCFLRIA